VGVNGRAGEVEEEDEESRWEYEVELVEMFFTDLDLR